MPKEENKMKLDEYVKYVVEEPKQIKQLLEWMSEQGKSKNFSYALDIIPKPPFKDTYKVVIVNNESDVPLMLQGPFAYVYAALDGVCEYNIRK